jgi:RNA polymerase sigma-70 factor (ECF subfamily)
LHQIGFGTIFVKNNYKCFETTFHHHKSPGMIYAIQQNQVSDQLDRISNSLRAFSLKLTGNNSDAEDLYQDTAVRIITNADKYNPGTNFKAWAVTIMRNIFINNYRKKVRRNMIIDQTPNNYYLNSGDRMVDNDGETNVTFNELMALVNTLPEDFKVPFMMAYEGFKYEEIAEELGSPLGTIKSRIFFARKKLQKLYEDTYASFERRA